VGFPLKPGEIIHLDWSPQAGSEMAQKHYGVILSVEAFNKAIPRVVVAPITSKERPEFGPLRVPLQTTQGRVTGYICLDHIRTLDPDSRGASSSQDELTFSCKTQCKGIIKKIFGI